MDKKHQTPFVFGDNSIILTQIQKDARVAQWIEQKFPKLLVGGSIPLSGTSFQALDSQRIKGFFHAQIRHHVALRCFALFSYVFQLQNRSEGDINVTVCSTLFLPVWPPVFW